MHAHNLEFHFAETEPTTFVQQGSRWIQTKCVRVDFSWSYNTAHKKKSTRERTRLARDISRCQSERARRKWKLQFHNETRWLLFLLSKIRILVAVSHVCKLTFSHLSLCRHILNFRKNTTLRQIQIHLISASVRLQHWANLTKNLVSHRSLYTLASRLMSKLKINSTIANQFWTDFMHNLTFCFGFLSTVDCRRGVRNFEWEKRGNRTNVNTRKSFTKNIEFKHKNWNCFAMGSLKECRIEGFICRLCSAINSNVIHIYSEEGEQISANNEILYTIDKMFEIWKLNLKFSIYSLEMQDSWRS